MPYTQSWRRPRTIARTLFSLLLFPAWIQAQEAPELGSDRPGLGDSTGLVGGHVLQVEGGLQFEDSDGARLFAAPELLLRWGLSERFELRVGAEGLLSEKGKQPDAKRETGLSDVVVSAKLGLLTEGEQGLDLTLSPVLSIPTKNDTFSSGTFDPGLEILWGHSLAGGFALAGNFNVGLPEQDGSRVVDTAAGVAVDHEIPGSLDAFLEIFAEATPFEEQSSTALTLDGGCTYGLGVDAQLDVSAGVGLTDAASNWFVGAGIVRRFR